MRGAAGAVHPALVAVADDGSVPPGITSLRYGDDSFLPGSCRS
ncbi:MAG: hypothetical protein R2882_15910 [Gemmatimonadales bacterium]